MRWKRKAEETAKVIKEEKDDDRRLREDVAIRQHDLARRLAVVQAQGRVLRGGT